MANFNSTSNPNIISTYLRLAFILFLLPSAIAQTWLENEFLRFGSGSVDSFVSSSPRIAQPFYKHGSDYTKLTYTDSTGYGYAFATVVHVDGSAVTPTSCAAQDVSSHDPGTGAGTGSLSTSCTLTSGSNTWTLVIKAIMEAGNRVSEIEFTTNPTSVTGNPVINIWFGTSDDWVGTTDAPTKTIGDFTSAGFIEGGLGSAAGGRAIKVRSCDFYKISFYASPRPHVPCST